MSSLDDLAAAILAALESARTANAAIGSTCDQAEELRDQLAAIGMDNKSTQFDAIATGLGEDQAQALRMASMLEAALAVVNGLRGQGGSAGKPANDKPVPARTGPDGGPSRTRPSMPPDPDRKPKGLPEEPDGSAEKIESIKRQRAVATILAKLGYSVEESPPPRENGKRPDYIIEGQWWDCYAARSPSPRNVRAAIRRKVSRDQADRILLDLGLSDVDVEALRHKLLRDPITGLKEVKAIQGNTVIDLYVWNEE